MVLLPHRTKLLSVLAPGLPPSDGAKGKLGIGDLKEGYHAAEVAFG